MRRRRFKDRYDAGKSDVVPYVPGENALTRHFRRWLAATRNDCGLRDWLSANGWQLTITNEGHHWKMWLDRNGTRHVVQWWPSSAKVVFGRNYRNGIHAHDGGQVLCLIQQRFNDGGNTR